MAERNFENLSGEQLEDALRQVQAKMHDYTEVHAKLQGQQGKEEIRLKILRSITNLGRVAIGLEVATGSVPLKMAIKSCSVDEIENQNNVPEGERIFWRDFFSRIEGKQGPVFPYRSE